jgi:hypothetical protein
MMYTKEDVWIEIINLHININCTLFIQIILRLIIVLYRYLIFQWSFQTHFSSHFDSLFKLPSWIIASHICHCSLLLLHLTNIALVQCHMTMTIASTTYLSFRFNLYTPIIIQSIFLLLWISFRTVDEKPGFSNLLR